MFKVAVYASEIESFQKTALRLEALDFQKDAIHFADSRRFTRLDVINQNVGQWIFFIDHDCELQATSLAEIAKLVQSYHDEKGVVVAGLYENPQQATILQRAHNWIANTWLTFSYSNGDEPLILGGCFLVRAPSPVVGLLPQDMWGAEDKKLAQILKQNKMKFFFHPEVKIKHNTSKSWMHFVRRAWLHGRNDIDYGASASSDQTLLAWLKKIASADFELIAPILLHFCIQKTAKQVRQILRTNKQ